MPGLENLGNLELYKISNYLFNSDLLNLCLSKKIFYLRIWNKEKYWQFRYLGHFNQKYESVVNNNHILKNYRPNIPSWYEKYQRMFQLFMFMDYNKNLHEQSVSQLQNLDGEYSSDGFISFKRDKETLSRHAWIGFSKFSSDDIFHFVKWRKFKNWDLVRNDLLFWSLCQELNPKQYLDSFPFHVGMSYNEDWQNPDDCLGGKRSFTEDEGLNLYDEGLNLYLSEENYSWLLPFLEHYQMFESWFIYSTLCETHVPEIIQYIFQRFPDLEFNVDWITESIDIQDPSKAAKKVRIIKDKYGIEPFLQPENKEKLDVFFSFSFPKPSGRAIIGELDLLT